MAMTKSIPDGHHGPRPYLVAANAAGCIEFYKQALGARERFRLAEPSGRIGHAELDIGGAVLMIADEHPERDVRGPRSIGGSPVTIHLYVEDVDATMRRAEAAGAKLRRPVEDQFYGDRGGMFEDPGGHLWWIATHKKDVAPDELQRRAQKLHGAG
jgi:PhnB protein